MKDPQALLEVADPVTSTGSEKLGPDRHLDPACPIINIPPLEEPAAYEEPTLTYVGNARELVDGEDARLREVIRAFWGRR